jgi:hypothetical protein
VSELAFLSVDRARSDGGFVPRYASPLARALAGSTQVRDLSRLGKIEVRGDVDAVDVDVDAEIVRLGPRRALILCEYERCADLRERLHGWVVDVTGALAGIELEDEQAMRRLTDLDLDALPAVGKVAEVPAVVLREGNRFRLFFPQELGHYLVEVVLDTLRGLEWR